MDRGQLRVLIPARATAQIHSPEQIPRALLLLLPALSAAAVGFLDRPGQLPTVLVAAQAVGLAVIAGADDFALGDPEEVGKRQHLRGDGDDGLGRLLGRRGVDDCDAAVVRGEGEGVAGWREGYAVHPACRAVQVLAADCVEGQALTPGAWLGAGVGALDEGAEDAGMAVRAAGGEKHAVRVPCDTGDGGAERLLQVLGHPPVVLFLEVADGDDAGSGADGELGFVGAPAHTSGSTVDTEKYERGLPLASLAGFPDVGVAVLRAGHNAAAVRGDVDAGNELVMATELILQAVLVSLLGVQLDVVGAGDGEGAAVGREGVVGDGSVEEVVDFGSGHGWWIGWLGGMICISRG